jgi:hypothetical protein
MNAMSNAAARKQAMKPKTRTLTRTFGIPRPWEPGTTAIVTVTARDSVDIRHAITRAATEWARTPSGAEATAHNRAHGWDFSLPELSAHLADPRLKRALRRHGILRLTVQTVEGYGEPWDVDDTVVDFDALATATQRTSNRTRPKPARTPPPR